MNKKLAIGIIGSACLISFLSGTIVSTMLSAQSGSPVAPPTFTPPTFSFLKDLKSGGSGQDVRQLQIVLNSDKDTRVSDSGVGSKGQESTYFGKLTANAVMRFQLKYGISATGFVGPLTRAKLNQIILATVKTLPVRTTADGLSATTSPSVSSTSLVSGPLPLAKERLPRLYTLRPQQIKKGDTFTLVGTGFQVENTIHIGSNSFFHVLPQDGSNISFTIPAMTTIQNGTYDVWVENSKGTSQVSSQPIKLTITDIPRPTSVVSSVLPATVSGAGTVTVTGTGFTSSGNDVVSGFGTIKNLSSTGTQITFSPRSLLSPEVAARIKAGTSIKIDFYIVNANGTSNVPGSVNLKL